MDQKPCPDPDDARHGVHGGEAVGKDSDEVPWGNSLSTSLGFPESGGSKFLPAEVSPPDSVLTK